MFGWKRKTVWLSSFLLLLSITTITDAIAKTPKKCVKVPGWLRVADPVLCKDGSPNLYAFKLLSQDMPRTMKLEANATDQKIRSAICMDSGDAIGPAVDAAVEYIFVWREFQSKELSYRSIMNAYYQGDWQAFCRSGSAGNQSNSSSKSKPKHTYQDFNNCVDENYTPPAHYDPVFESHEISKNQRAWWDCQDFMPSESDHKLITKSNANFNACVRARTRPDLLVTRAAAQGYCWDLQK